MTQINVLFVPNPMASHIVPLVVLAKQLPAYSFKCAFLLPQKFHAYVKNLGLPVLDIDRNMSDKTIPEMMAFGKFKPHVVVDDLSYTTAFSTRLAKIPRISVVRKGVLPFEIHDPNHNHSSTVIKFLDEVKKLNIGSHGLWEPKHYTDLFIGDVNIIPAIPSVEELPKELSGNPSYVYSGPLLLPDDDIMNNTKYLSISMHGRKIEDQREKLNRFLVENKTLKKIYFTQGITLPGEIQKRASACVRLLLDKGVAVITNVTELKDLTDEEASRYYSSNFLPMNTICSQVHIMIHHCGSGTYNYQLKNKVPGIILGSKYYDRDEVGMQLQKLKAGLFISADLDEQSYSNKFNEAVTQLLDSSSKELAQQKEALLKLDAEIKTTQNAFDFKAIVLRIAKK